MSLVAVLFRVELIGLFVVVAVWCAVKVPEVLSTKRSAVFESLGALGAVEPLGRVADMQYVRFSISNSNSKELLASLEYFMVDFRSRILFFDMF